MNVGEPLFLFPGQFGWKRRRGVAGSISGCRESGPVGAGMARSDAGHRVEISGGLQRGNHGKTRRVDQRSYRS